MQPFPITSHDPSAKGMNPRQNQALPRIQYTESAAGLFDPASSSDYLSTYRARNKKRWTGSKAGTMFIQQHSAPFVNVQPAMVRSVRSTQASLDHLVRHGEMRERMPESHRRDIPCMHGSGHSLRCVLYLRKRKASIDAYPPRGFLVSEMVT